MTPEQWTRFESKVERVTESGCWIWLGTIINGGYGHCSLADRRVLAHRASYEHVNGAIPAGLVLDHLCRVRECVNPAHLRAVTQRDNVLAPGSQCLTKRHAEKSHCPRGHAYSGDNLWFNDRGGRRCRICTNASNRAGKLRREAGCVSS